MDPEDRPAPASSLALTDALVPSQVSRDTPPSWRLRPDLRHATGEPQLVAELDTNALATACCMEAVPGHQSLATRLVLTGRLPRFIAEYVPSEMDKHLERIVRRMGIEHVASLLRVVALPIGEYLRPEIAGISQPKPAGQVKRR